mgnify:CR=1 FL=1
MKSVASFALGSKVNQAESEAVAEAFADKGYEVKNIDEKADVYIINTCAVTNFGDKKSRQLLRKVKKLNPEAVVVAAGCYAQTDSAALESIPEVDIIVGTKGRHKIVDEVERFFSERKRVCLVSDIMKEHDFEPISIRKLAGRTRAYIKIQDGCSQFCSYCIIPYARGPVRSRDEEDILKEVSNLALNGFKEVVLTGIHVASYGKDNHKSDLLTLIKRVSLINGIERIRLSSVEPNIVTEEFAHELSTMYKVCHHFHLSLQSGCDKTLEAMNRKYTTEKYLQAVEILRKYMPDVAITTDIIVGFPGESDSDYEESFRFAEKVGFAKIHVFPYSPKKGTPAAGMKCQIPSAIKSVRASKLIKLSDDMEDRFIGCFKGRVLDVLFEKGEGGFFEGHTSNYIKVFVKTDENLRNMILPVRIQDVSAKAAYGEICRQMT